MKHREAVDGAKLRQHYIAVGLIVPADPAEIPDPPAMKDPKPKAVEVISGYELFFAVARLIPNAFFGPDQADRAVERLMRAETVIVYDHFAARVGKLKVQPTNLRVGYPRARIYRLAA